VSDCLGPKGQKDYAGAQNTMRPFWRGVVANSEYSRTGPSTTADLLLCTGVLTSWIGSKNQVSDAQEIAK